MVISGSEFFFTLIEKSNSRNAFLSSWSSDSGDGDMKLMTIGLKQWLHINSYCYRWLPLSSLYYQRLLSPLYPGKQYGRHETVVCNIFWKKSIFGNIFFSWENCRAADKQVGAKIRAHIKWTGNKQDGSLKYSQSDEACAWEWFHSRTQEVWTGHDFVVLPRRPWCSFSAFSLRFQTSSWILSVMYCIISTWNQNNH